MPTKTWTLTADFATPSEGVLINDGLYSNHAGCLNGEPFDSTHHPDIHNETKSGWTEKLVSNLSAVTFSGSKMLVTSIDDADEAKLFTYFRELITTFDITTVFEAGVRIKFTDFGGDVALLLGYFKEGDTTVKNNISFGVNDAGLPFLFFFDNIGTVEMDMGSPGDELIINTDCYVKLLNDGTYLRARGYSTLIDYNADTNRTFNLSIDVSSVGAGSGSGSGVVGNLTCDRFGFRNSATSGETQSVAISWITDDQCYWYEDGTADTTDYENSAVQMKIDYSTFAATETGVVKYKRNRKLTKTGGYTLDAAWQTAIQIAALTDEFLYGLGFEIMLDSDGLTRFNITDLTFDFLDEVTVPFDIVIEPTGSYHVDASSKMLGQHRRVGGIS